MNLESPAKNNQRSWIIFWIPVLLGIPALLISWSVVFTGGPHLTPLYSTVIFGLGIVGAAALLAWASEVIELDIGQGLALALIALVAVLPEYAVDIFLAYQAGSDPSSLYSSYATANMTGGNRLIVGLGWPLVVLIYWLNRKKRVDLSQAISLELSFLVLAAIYAGVIIIKGNITIFDSVILFTLFGAYVWLSRKTEHESTDLVGPAKSVASLGVTGRRVVVASVFSYSILLILFSTELFAEGLIETGAHFGINEFILIQWLAPLASESPEMLIAGYFALKGSPRAALTMLISATINQWTLLVGSLPIAYSFGFGSIAGLPLTTGEAISFVGTTVHRQQVELFLTVAQTILAISLVLRLYASWQGMGLLLVFFVFQLVFSGTDQRLALGFVAVLIAATVIIADRQRRDQIGVTSKYLLTMLGLRSS